MVRAPSLPCCLEDRPTLEDLLSLIYVLPVGIVKFRADGRIELINPRASEALLRLLGDNTLSNIYSALSGQVPGLRGHVLGYAGTSGRICHEMQLPVGLKLFSLSIHKLDEFTYLAILQDASELAKLNERLKEDSEKQKRQEEEIRTIGMQFSEALDNIAQGVSMFDAQQRIRALAQDESIIVAGPVLSTSERLDDTDLVHGAKSHSQSHLLAISKRKTLSPGVTDALLERGDQQVVRGTVCNPGAEFSEFGYSAMVEKAQDDENLAMSVWCRPDIPRIILVKLFKESSAAVQLLFEAQDSMKSRLIREAVTKASSRLMKESRATSAVHAEAFSNVQSLFSTGNLDETHLAGFAMSDDFDGTSVALSLLSDLPIELIERVFVQGRLEQLLVILKALDVTWATAKAIILLMSEPSPVASDEIEHAMQTFARLQPKTAKTAIQFYRLREQATAD